MPAGVFSCECSHVDDIFCMVPELARLRIYVITVVTTIVLSVTIGLENCRELRLIYKAKIVESFVLMARVESSVAHMFGMYWTYEGKMCGRRKALLHP